MPALIDLFLKGSRVEHDGLCARYVVDAAVWTFAIEQLANGRWSLLGLWGETDCVHMALFEEAAGERGIVTLHCPEGRYRSVGEQHPPAIRLERAIHDLFGLEPEGLPDSRSWLDHGQWGVGILLALGNWLSHSHLMLFSVPMVQA